MLRKLEVSMVELDNVLLVWHLHRGLELSNYKHSNGPPLTALEAFPPWKLRPPTAQTFCFAAKGQACSPPVKHTCTAGPFCPKSVTDVGKLFSGDHPSERLLGL